MTAAAAATAAPPSPAGAPPPPPTTVVIPTLNEAHNIGPVIELLLREGPEGPVRELIVADGGSVDGTQDIVRRLAARDARIRLLHNPVKIQSAGINAAVAAADPATALILRVDAHAGYPPDFVRRTIETMERVGADSVVVRLVTSGQTRFQRAVAAILNSALGTGGSVHRVGGRSGFVDHGHHALFRRAVFDELGGYDETFVANEDAELDIRMVASGRRIWFENDIEIVYYPRANWRSLARQYWRYGVGRAQNLRKHRTRPHLRQLAPPLLVAGLGLATAAAPVWPLLISLPLAYLVALPVAGAFAARRAGEPGLTSPAALALGVVHLTWGGGFLAGLIRPRQTQPDPRARALTGTVPARAHAARTSAASRIASLSGCGAEKRRDEGFTSGIQHDGEGGRASRHP